MDDQIRENLEQLCDIGEVASADDQVVKLSNAELSYLAGRTRNQALWLLSQAEIFARREQFEEGKRGQQWGDQRP